MLSKYLKFFDEWTLVIPSYPRYLATFWTYYYYKAVAKLHANLFSFRFYRAHTSIEIILGRLYYRLQYCVISSFFFTFRLTRSMVGIYLSRYLVSKLSFHMYLSLCRLFHKLLCWHWTDWLLSKKRKGGESRKQKVSK